MDARAIWVSLCLAACGSALADLPAGNPRSFADLWRTSAGAELRLEECVLRVALPNPEYPSDYQDVVRRTWSMRHSGRLPVFFTYAYDQSLFVILDARCAVRAELSRELENYLHRNDRLRAYRVRPASAEEVRVMLSVIDSLMLHGTLPPSEE